MTDLHEDIAAFDRMQAGLEAEHLDEWVLFYRGKLEGLFKSFESAAEVALERFDLGPYLIRQVGAGPVQLSGGIMMRPAHANGPSRI